MTTEPITKPRFSASEERLFKQCRLAHHMQYDLGFTRVIPGRRLAVGILFHDALATLYLSEFDLQAALDRLNSECDRRWDAILQANPNMSGYAESLLTAEKDRDLLIEMVRGYFAWRNDTGIDEGYDTVEVEVSHLIEIPGAVADIPIRMDLVQRKRSSGRLRIVDFKTARSIPSDMTGYQLAEQNGNYQLACLALFGERPTEMAYRFARKIIPSAKSKPPYFAERILRLTPEELRYRLEEFKTVSAERFDPSRAIYPEPDNCCGSWRNDWAAPCKLVHMGYDPSDALEASPGFARADAYERYADLEEDE